MKKDSKKQQLELLIWSLAIAFGAIVFLPIIIYCITNYSLFELHSDPHGNIGDAIGGITAPIIGVGSAILVFITFKIQANFNKMQNINSDRDTLLALFNDIKTSINSLDFRCEKYELKKEEQRNRKGIDAIKYFFEKLNLRHIEKLNKDSCVKEIRNELERFNRFLILLNKPQYKEQDEVRQFVSDYFEITLKDVLSKNEYMNNFAHILLVDREDKSFLNRIKKTIDDLKDSGNDLINSVERCNH